MSAFGKADIHGRHRYQSEKPTSQIDSLLYRHVLRHGLVVSRRVDVAGGIHRQALGLSKSPFGEDRDRSGRVENQNPSAGTRVSGGMS